MIISRLTHGLGNQLFQYALGRALAHRLGVPLKLDLSSRGYGNLRPCQLHHFRIRAPAATLLEVAPFCYNPRWGKARRALRRVYRVLFFRRRQVVRFEQPQFNPAVFRARPPAYVVGYWQSERFFAEVAAQLREEFALRSPLSPGGQAMLSAIRAAPSLGVHVRRGDYAAEPVHAARYGACSPGYYRAAVAHIRAQAPAARLFVFSDEIEWVKQNLPLPGPVSYRDAPGLGDYEDFYLLSQCQHQVIANSTFGWWAAWLNPNPDKIVAGPHPWYRDPAYASADIIPAAWARFPADG